MYYIYILKKNTDAGAFVSTYRRVYYHRWEQPIDITIDVSHDTTVCCKYSVGRTIIALLLPDPFLFIPDVSFWLAPCCYALTLCYFFLLQASPEREHYRTRPQRPRKVHELLIK